MQLLIVLCLSLGSFLSPTSANNYYSTTEPSSTVDPIVNALSNSDSTSEISYPNSVELVTNEEFYFTASTPLIYTLEESANHCIEETIDLSNIEGDPKRLLDRVSAKYSKFESFKADFTLVTKNQDAGINETQEGKIYVKGDKYRIETDEIERICDNESVWTYFKAEEEVQINDFELEDGELSPAKIFTVYKDGFKFKLPEQDNPNYTTIDLTPIEKNMPYSKIRLHVNKETLLIDNADIFEKNGTLITYKLANVDTKEMIKDDFFSFDEKAYPALEVIDLREE